jgi:hypothetical protein
VAFGISNNCTFIQFSLLAEGKEKNKTQHKILFFDKFSISENCGGFLLIDFQEIA